MFSKSIMRKNQNWTSFEVKHKLNRAHARFGILPNKTVVFVNTKLQPEHFCSAAVLSWMPCPRSHPWNLILDYRFELNLLDRICSKMYFGCAVATLYLWVEWKVAWCKFFDLRNLHWHGTKLDGCLHRIYKDRNFDMSMIQKRNMNFHFSTKYFVSNTKWIQSLLLLEPSRWQNSCTAQRPSLVWNQHGIGKSVFSFRNSLQTQIATDKQILLETPRPGLSLTSWISDTRTQCICTVHRAYTSTNKRNN